MLCIIQGGAGRLLLFLSFPSEWTVYTATFSPSSQNVKGHQLEEGEQGDQCGYWGFLLENTRLH